MNNEPAFPMFKPRIENYCQEEVIPGMTLRDYFAAKAMNGWASGRNNGSDFCQLDHPAHDFKFVAESSYRFADAMMKARENHAI